MAKQQDPEEIRIAVTFALYTQGIAFRMPEENHRNFLYHVTRRIKSYHELCQTFNRPPTVAGLASALGTTKEILLRDWANGKINNPKAKEIAAVIVKEISMINALLEDGMTGGTLSPVNGIFLLKNNFGYKDESEVVVAPDLRKRLTDDELIAEAKKLPQIKAQTVAELTADEVEPKKK